MANVGESERTQAAHVEYEDVEADQCSGLLLVNPSGPSQIQLQAWRGLVERE